MSIIHCRAWLAGRLAGRWVVRTASTLRRATAMAAAAAAASATAAAPWSRHWQRLLAFQPRDTLPGRPLAAAGKARQGRGGAIDEISSGQRVTATFCSDNIGPTHLHVLVKAQVTHGPQQVVAGDGLAPLALALVAGPARSGGEEQGWEGGGTVGAGTGEQNKAGRLFPQPLLAALCALQPLPRHAHTHTPSPSPSALPPTHTLTRR